MFRDEVLTYGSLVIGLLALAACWLSGRRATRPAGAALALLNAVLVLPYNLITAQYGFMVTSLVFVVLHVRTLRNVRRERAEFTALTDREPHRTGDDRAYGCSCR